MEEFEEYRRELLAALGEDDPLEVLGGSVQAVRELTEAVPADRMSREPAPGEWSAWQVLSHLADTDLVHGVRVRMVLTGDRPLLVAYDQERWAGRLGGLDQAARQTFLRWRILREANLALFESLTGEEWERTGLHSERGEESLRLMIALQAGHDRVHLEQMRRCLS